MRRFRVHAFVGITLLVGAAGCELVAGLGDIELAPASSDGSVEGATGETSTASGFSISDLPQATVQQDGSTSIQVTITRTGSFADAINITLSGLPAGASTTPLLITGDQTSGTLTLAASATTPQGLSHLSIDGVNADGKVSASGKMDLLVRGAPGSLDLLYGDQGFFNSTSVVMNGAALDANDNVVVSGIAGTQVASLRVTPTGAIDPTFASGLFTKTTTSNPSSMLGVFPEATGPILYGATTGVGAEYFRVTATGDYDPAYSSDGGVDGWTDEPGLVLLNAFAVDGSERMVVGGRLLTSPQKLYVERRTASGAPDPAFTAAAYTVGTADAQVRAVAVQADDKVVATCFATDSAGVGFSLNRFNTNGSPDTSFGTNGYVGTVANALANPAAIAFQADGSILVSGAATTGVIARFTPNGTEDASYGTSGAVSLPFNPLALAVQSDGKLVVAGSAVVATADGGTTTVFAVSRLLTNGSFDSTFGTAGIARAPLGDVNAQQGIAYRVMIQKDGRIVLVGQTTLASSAKETTIARFWP